MIHTATLPTTIAIPESDQLQHSEDERLFWTPRDGRQIKLAWNELTSTEQQLQREASERAAYEVLFCIYE